MAKPSTERAVAEVKSDSILNKIGPDKAEKLLEKFIKDRQKRTDYNERRRIELAIYKQKAIKAGIRVTKEEVDAGVAKINRK
ncbi:MAG: hypothetical protein ACWGQW_04815 [bacterium]